MNIPLAQIYEVLTFYTYFKLESPGKVLISVCTGTTCYLKGATDVVAEIEQQLAIKTGETTPDSFFHLQTVRCLGCCGLAPVMAINGTIYGKIKKEDIKGILSRWRDRYKQGEA
jgi:NADH-quinone oxidoreductase subunit E